MVLLSGPMASSLDGLRRANLPLCGGVTILMDVNHSELLLMNKMGKVLRNTLSLAPQVKWR